MTDINTIGLEAYAKTPKAGKGTGTPKTYLMWQQGEAFYNVLATLRSKNINVKALVEHAVGAMLDSVASKQK